MEMAWRMWLGGQLTTSVFGVKVGTTLMSLSDGSQTPA